MMARKKENVLVAVNTLTSIHMNAYFDHSRMFYRLGKDHPRTTFSQFFARRMSIDRFRNAAAQCAINNKSDYLFFVDDDMMLPHDTFAKLREANYDIISALNYIRGYPFEIMAFKMDPMKDKPRNLSYIKEEDLPNPLGSVMKVEAIGTAVSLIKVDLIKKIPAPWFITGPHNTEDVYFCIKAKEHYPRVKIGMHTGVETGHILEPEVICHSTKRHLKAYYESYMDPAVIESMAEAGERSIEYAKENFPDAEPKEVTPELKEA